MNVLGVYYIYLTGQKIHGECYLHTMKKMRKISLMDGYLHLVKFTIYFLNWTEYMLNIKVT